MRRGIAPARFAFSEAHIALFKDTDSIQSNSVYTANRGCTAGLDYCLFGTMAALEPIEPMEPAECTLRVRIGTNDYLVDQETCRFIDCQSGTPIR